MPDTQDLPELLETVRKHATDLEAELKKTGTAVAQLDEAKTTVKVAGKALTTSGEALVHLTKTVNELTDALGRMKPEKIRSSLDQVKIGIGIVLLAMVYLLLR